MANMRILGGAIGMVLLLLGALANVIELIKENERPAVKAVRLVMLPLELFAFWAIAGMTP